jgi:glycosyltransferase involved in cell wall biosynthesis
MGGRNRRLNTAGWSVSEHVLFVVNAYPPKIGGLEQHLFQLAHSLVALGVRVSVVTLSDPVDGSVQDGPDVIRVPGWLNVGHVFSLPRAGLRRRLDAFITEHEVTAISVHTRFFPLTWWGVAAGRRHRLPVVLTEHGSDHVRGVSWPVAAVSRAVDWTLGRWAMRQATAVLAVSDEGVDFVRRLSGRQADTFFNAADVEFWRAAVPQPGRRFVTVGRLVPGKGWDDAIAAYDQLCREDGDQGWELVVVGDGPELAAARAAASRVSSGSVRVLGRQNHEQIRGLLAGNWLVNPTTLAEGFGMVLIEAALAGAGIISYATPGLAPLRASGAVVRLATDRDDLVAHLRTARALAVTPLPAGEAEAWSWESRGEQYLGHLRAAVAGVPR